jgi:hypothetical protein
LTTVSIVHNDSGDFAGLSDRVRVGVQSYIDNRIYLSSAGSTMLYSLYCTSLYQYVRSHVRSPLWFLHRDLSGSTAGLVL